MLKLALFLLLVSQVFATYYAVDFTDQASLDQLKCLQNLNYQMIKPRVSKANGEVDFNGIQTILTMQQNNDKIGFYVVGVITPQVNVTDGGLLQIYKLQQAMIGYQIYNYGTLALQITRDSAPWSSDQTANSALINSMIGYLKADFNIDIFTTYADWVAITGNSAGIPGYVFLWYSNVFGAGVTGESPPNYNDFVAFGSWNKSGVVSKQFAVGENLCGLNVNRDVHVV